MKTKMINPYLSKVKVTIIENEELKDEKVRRENLIHFYDVMNRVINKLDEDKREQCFISDEKLKEMEESGKYRFI